MKKNGFFLKIGIVILVAFAVAIAFAFLNEEERLRFSAGESFRKMMVLPGGDTIWYQAYENHYYVSHIEDSTCQYLNIYVPEAVIDKEKECPIFFRTYVGGYRSSSAREPSPTDATGRALKEGYVVVIPGCRGWNSEIQDMLGIEIFNGRAPAALLDLKAAIRYLRYNDLTLPGNSEQIITDGTSAGGALSSLLGTTANHPIFDSYLKEMGVADATDEVFASVCYCPITNLNNADMAYEWLYNCTNNHSRPLSDAQVKISDELAAGYPDYLNSLQLKSQDSILLTDITYRDYLKSFLIQSAQRARNEGFEIPESAGFKLNDDRTAKGEFVLDLDLTQYLNYVASRHSLKEPPAFDRLGVLNQKATPENDLFGDKSGLPANFTVFSLSKATGNPKAALTEEQHKRVVLMNPFNFIINGSSQTASHWYIRHGALDRDTGFDVSLNLATLLMNRGYDVNFAFAWNRDHSGDYNLDDLFAWLIKICNEDQTSGLDLNIPVIKDKQE